MNVNLNKLEKQIAAWTGSLWEQKYCTESEKVKHTPEIIETFCVQKNKCLWCGCMTQEV
jgi:hypothetical protein